MTPGLCLASKSPARRRILENAGIRFRWCDAGVDEERLKSGYGDGRRELDGLAPVLAEAKATAAYEVKQTDEIFIGCDQILVLEGRLYDKPATLADARAHLRAFSGRTHQLISAICLLRAGQMFWSCVDTVDMSVRPLSDDFIDAYVREEGNRLLTSVGAYLLESRGAQLFERIDGDYFTVLGLPLLPLLEELRNRGILSA